jgi:hypothetical protein
MATVTLPWVPLLPGYRGYLVLEASLRPLQVKARRVSARRYPRPAGSPATVGRWLAERGR